MMAQTARWDKRSFNRDTGQWEWGWMPVYWTVGTVPRKSYADKQKSYDHLIFDISSLEEQVRQGDPVYWGGRMREEDEWTTTK